MIEQALPITKLVQFQDSVLSWPCETEVRKPVESGSS